MSVRKWVKEPVDQRGVSGAGILGGLSGRHLSGNRLFGHGQWYVPFIYL